MLCDLIIKIRLGGVAIIQVTFGTCLTEIEPVFPNYIFAQKYMRALPSAKPKSYRYAVSGCDELTLVHHEGLSKPQH